MRYPAPTLGSVRRLIRSLLTGATIALYMTAAFAIVPALGSADTTDAGASQAAVNGALMAVGLLVVTLGTAVTRWFREEQPES